jgi:hypothetical protein
MVKQLSQVFTSACAKSSIVRRHATSKIPYPVDATDRFSDTFYMVYCCGGWTSEQKTTVCQSGQQFKTACQRPKANGPLTIKPRGEYVNLQKSKTRRIIKQHKTPAHGFVG